MAVANAKQQGQQRQAVAPVARETRTRQELLEQALKQPALPSAEMLADLDRQMGQGAALWLMEELAHAGRTPADPREPTLRAAPPANGAETAEKVPEAKKAEKEGQWHKPEHHLLEGKKEGFDNKVLATHGWAAMRTDQSDSQTSEVKRRSKPSDGPKVVVREKVLKADTHAQIVETSDQRAAGGLRTVEKSKTTKTHGDAAVIERIDGAAEEAKKARKERETKGLVKKVENHDFAVAGREREWGKREHEEAAHKLYTGPTGNVSAAVAGPSESAKVGGEVAVGVANGVTVAGNVSVKGVAFEGGVKYVSPPIPMTVLGEKLRAIVAVAFKAEALAEAKAGVQLKILARSDGLDVDIGGGRGTGASGSAEAFAGLRAGVDAALTLDWQKRADYLATRREQLLAFFQQTVGLPGGHITRLVLEKASKILMGDPGWFNLLKVAAGIEASAGAGAAAAFDAAIGGGRVKFSSKLKGSIGLGFGGKAALDASILEGTRFLAVMTAVGGAAAAEGLGLSKDRILAGAKEQLRALL